MGRTATVSTRLIAGILRAGEAAGVSPARALRHIGVSPDAIADPDGWIALDLEVQLWDFMCAQTGGAYFGLSAGAMLRAGDLDVMDYAIRSSPTLRDAMGSAVRYLRLLHDVAVLELVVGDDEAAFTHRFKGGLAVSRQAADFVLAIIQSMGRELTGTPWVPLRVRFQHARPPGAERYQAFFGAPVLFDQPHNAFVFDRRHLDMPIVGADPALHRILRRHADELLDRLPDADDIIEQCRGELSGRILGGDASLQAVSRALAMSPRTLQRRLRDKGSSFQDMVSEMRSELAIALLGERRMSVAEVGYLLGYSQPSAFHRAFRKWTGSSPASYR